MTNTIKSRSHKAIALAAALMLTVMLSACQTATSVPDATDVSTAVETTMVENPAAAKADMFADFSKGTSPFFEPSDGWSNEGVFNCVWLKENCTFNDNRMQLTIKSNEGKYPYSSSEYRSKDFYGYGRYEVSMKAIKNDGVVSSFFTYTGPSDKNPWDEVDVEILGKDTTKVQFNYYTNGKGNHEFMYDLGFDAAEDFHTYAFEWSVDKITWFVDGKEAYSANKDIPVTNGKIMVNAWNGKNVDGWLKPFDDSKLPLSAEYEWIAYYSQD